MKELSSDSITKITARLYAPVCADFDKQMARAMLKRDAFLDRVIATEVVHLREDLAGKVLSPKARRYIAGALKSMGGGNVEELHPVNFSVSKSTAAALREAVDAHNLQRDAFLNWLIVLLRSSDYLLNLLGVGREIQSIRGYSFPNLPVSPLQAIEEIESDPLFYLRIACEAEHGKGLYNLPLPRPLHGLCCYLPDEAIPIGAEFDQSEEL